MGRAKLIKIALLALIIAVTLWLFNHIMSFPMEFRNGCWQEWLGEGPAGKPMYRAYRLVDMEPIKADTHFRKEVEKGLSKAGVISLNSPYGPSGTIGRPRNWFSNRPVMVAPALSSFSYQIKIPEQARLYFGIAVKAYMNKKIQNGARFIVEWRNESGNKKLFEQTIEPAHENYWEMTKDRERLWYEHVHPALKKRGDIFKDVVVDLSKYAGQEGELRFITEPVIKDKSLEYSHCLWGSPEIWVERPADEKPPLNVVIFMIEATPTTIIEPYVDEPAVHPNIRKFSEGAVVFDKFFTAGDSTNLSVYPFFTGRHYTSLGLPQEMYYLAPMVKARFYKRRFPSLAEAFTRAGYRTAAIGTNHYFVATREFGLDLGFDQVEVLARRWYAHGDTMLASMEWLRQNADKPFFLYIHYDAPHDEEKPYIEDLLRAILVKTTDRRWRYTKYLAQQMAADRDFGRLLEALENLGVRDRTLVIVTSDHGNCLDPAHDFAVLRADRDKPWRTPFQHGRAMSIEDIHIPFIIDWPIGPGEQKRIKEPASSIDMFPTLVDLLIKDQPDELIKGLDDLEGLSLASLITQDQENGIGRESVYCISRGGDHLIAHGRYHYISRMQGFQKILFPGHKKLRVVPERLFDLEKDPRELNDISSLSPDLLKRMNEEMERVKPKDKILNFLYMNYDKAHIKGEFTAFSSWDGPPEFVMTYPQERDPITLDPVPSFGVFGAWLYSFETELEGPTGIILDISFQHMKFEVEGEILNPEDWKLGAFGLPLFSKNSFNYLWGKKTDWWLMPSDTTLYGLRQPTIYIDEPGVYFYKMTFNDFVAESFSDEELSPAVKAVLKQWGYIE